MVLALGGMIKQYRALKTDSERLDLTEEILARYSLTATLLVLDMSGFSKITKDKGIVHFLAMVQQMQEIAQQQIEEHDGKIIKFFSDNCFAYFSEPKNGVDCAIKILETHHELNRTLVHPVNVCIGVDHGEFLLIEDNECFGHTVNRACKLGEDLAEKGELLVSAKTIQAIEDTSGYNMRAETFIESGLEISAYQLKI